MAYELSRGVARQINDSMEKNLTPTLQVYEVRKLQQPQQQPQQQQPQQQNDRFRAILSDGEHLLQCMLATQLNHLVTSERLVPGCVVKLEQYVPNNMNGRVVVVLVSVAVLTGALSIIGDPKAVGAPPQQQTPAPPGGESAPPRPQQPQQQRSAPSTSSGAPLQQQQQQQQSRYHGGGGGSAAIARSVPAAGQAEAPAQGYTKIRDVNQYQDQVIFRGRVTQKGDLRKFVNSRGAGQLFSFEIADDSGTLRVTAFHEKATEAHGLVELNGVYSISRGRFRDANAKYNHTGHKYEAMLEPYSVITQLPDDGSIERVAFSFAKIASLEAVATGSTVDLIGVVQSTDELREITARSSGNMVAKRDVTLLDDSNASVATTLWGERAKSIHIDADSHPVLLVKGAKRGDFNGVSMSTMPSSCVELNPDLPEAHALRGWYDSVGHAAQIRALSSGGGGGGGGANEARLRSGERKTFAQVNEEHVGEDASAPPGASYYNVRATVGLIRQDEERVPWYLSCPECKKKVHEEATGVWRCEKCDKQAEPLPRYVFSFQALDATGSRWLNCYDENGPVLLGGMAASELRELREIDPQAYKKVFEDAKFGEYVFRVRVRSEEYQGELRFRHMVVGAEKVDFDAECAMVEREIAQYDGDAATTAGAPAAAAAAHATVAMAM